MSKIADAKLQSVSFHDHLMARQTTKKLMEGDCGENSDLSKNAQITHFTQNGITAYRQRSFGGSIMPVHGNIGPSCSGDAFGVFCAHN